LRFKIHRGFKADGAVEPLAVVKDFNLFKEKISLPRNGQITEPLSFADFI
jgi:hypothetical protein